jgi:hypothetical protein
MTRKLKVGSVVSLDGVIEVPAMSSMTPKM